MTQPDMQGEPVPDAESLAFEALAVAAVAGGFAAQVTSLLGVMYASWDLIAGAALDQPDLGRTLARRIRRLTFAPMRPALERVAADGRDLGQTRAVTRYADPEDRRRAAATDWRTDGAPSVPDVDATARDLLSQAAVLAETLPFRNKMDVHVVAGRLRQGVARTQGAARWTANEGINAGTAAVARTMGQRLIWVTERNACLHCLAHAGYAVEPGDLFPGLTFDPLYLGRVLAVKWPPLHPNCRCQCRTYDGPAGPPPANRSLVDPAARLAGEARRSVVYQWTDYASGAAAVRAAESLLNAGADLPATVERRARQALRRGRGVRRPK